MNKAFKALALASALSLAAIPAFAADETTEAPASPFDIYFGTTITSNYVSKGQTQTDDDPAIQGYVELGYNIFYLGAWASNVSFGGASDTEIDFYGGIRPEFGKLSLDLGFAQYYYPNDPNDYGEAYIKGSYAFTDSFSLGAEYYHEVYADTNWANLTTEIALPEDFTFSGKVGFDFGYADRQAWDAGISRTFFDTVTADLRYYDANDDAARIVFSLSFDTSLSALTGK